MFEYIKVKHSNNILVKLRQDFKYIYAGKGSSKDSIKVFPLINLVVIMTKSTLESSCWEYVLSAEISLYVTPPMKKTRITLVESLIEELSLEMELRLF